MFKGMLTVKITNEKENHHGFQYQTGLNILQETFRKEGSCVPGGFYFTTVDQVHNFYDYGVYLRIVEIPDDAQVVKDPDETMGLKWRTDRIILGGKYPLCDVETIKKFDLKITEEYIRNLVKYGKVDVLMFLLEKHNSLISGFTSEALNYASQNGHVNVLEWWKNSGLELKYDEYALSLASKNGHVNVLDWWFKSGLPLKYDEYALNHASCYGNINVLDWWKNSGLPLRYNEYALDYASSNGHVEVLTWWKNSGLPLKYSEYALKSLEEGNVNVLEWWKNSGLPLKYNETALYWASFKGLVDVLDWWLKSGLPLKYDRIIIENLISHGTGLYAFNWWKNSGLLE
jgi:hypothetical protein